MALNSGSDPYVAKNFDLDFSSVRPENLFSIPVFGQSAQTLGQLGFNMNSNPLAGIAKGGLPAWFYGGVLVVMGATYWFALRGKGRK